MCLNSTRKRKLKWGNIRCTHPTKQNPPPLGHQSLFNTWAFSSVCTTPSPHLPFCRHSLICLNPKPHIPFLNPNNVTLLCNCSMFSAAGGGGLGLLGLLIAKPRSPTQSWSSYGPYNFWIHSRVSLVFDTHHYKIFNKIISPHTKARRRINQLIKLLTSTSGVAPSLVMKTSWARILPWRGRFNRCIFI